MTQEERDIYNFLKSTPGIYYSVREIARRAGKNEKRHEAAVWVVEFLQRLVRRGVLEVDPSGHYRLKPRPEIQAEGRKWVSPHIAKLLQNSPTDFSGAATIEINEQDLNEDDW